MVVVEILDLEEVQWEHQVKDKMKMLIDFY